MKDLVNQIVNMLEIRSNIDRKIVKGAVGVSLALLFFLIYYKWIVSWLRIAPAGSSVSQETVAIMSYLLACLGALWFLYYGLYYLIPMIICLIQYGIPPLFKNREKSIEGLLNINKIDDIGRMHKAILDYLKGESSVKVFVILFIWLKRNMLLMDEKQTWFLDALKVDFPEKQTRSTTKHITTVPPQSTFNENVTSWESVGKTEELNACLQVVEKALSKYVRSGTLVV